MKNRRIRSLNDDDKNAFRMLAHCGNASTATLKMVNLTPTRIENMCRDKLIACVDKNQRYQHKNEEAIWSLTNKGKDFIRSNMGIEKFSCGTNAVRHNSAVAEQYSFALKRDDVKDILTENDTRRLVDEKLKDLNTSEETKKDYYYWKDRYDNKEMSMPDITIITGSGTIECIEVITNNYREEEIIAKEVTIEFLNAEYTTIKI